MAQDSFSEDTEAANALLLMIYQMQRANIEALLQPRKAIATSSATFVQWEYLGNQDGQIHGPYSSNEMLGWIRAGYFAGPTALQVRTIQPACEEKKFIQENQLSDLMEDDDDQNEDHTV